MHEIRLEFRDLQDISLQDTLGLEVVYVLWGPHAKKGPSLISQGKLLEALANPDNAYRGKVRGMFASVEGNERTRRRDTDLVESALIAAAKDAAERGGVRLLVTTGDDDSVVAVGASERVAELLGEDVPFELLEQTGHLPMDERPDELAALLLRFIADEL